MFFNIKRINKLMKELPNMKQSDDRSTYIKKDNESILRAYRLIDADGWMDDEVPSLRRATKLRLVVDNTKGKVDEKEEKELFTDCKTELDEDGM